MWICHHLADEIGDAIHQLGLDESAVRGSHSDADVNVEHDGLPTFPVSAGVAAVLLYEPLDAMPTTVGRQERIVCVLEGDRQAKYLLGLYMQPNV